MGNRQLQSLRLVSLGMVMYGYVNGWMGPTIELFLSDESPVPLTSAQLSWIMGAPSVGAVFATVPSALLMSLLGRRGSLMLLNVLPFLAWIITYTTSSFTLLFVARVLAGSWIGICFTIISPYISEIVDPDLRSSLNTLPCIMQRLGTLTVFTIGTYSPYWVLCLVGLVFCFFYWIILLFVPESPYYYLLVNEEEKALKSLSWLQNNKNIDDKFYKLSKFVYAGQGNSDTFFYDLLKDPIHLKNLVKVTLATVFALCSGGVLMIILPILIPKHSLPYLNNKECSIIGAILCFSFSFRLNCLSLSSNRLSLMVSGIVCGICMGAMALWYYLEHKIAFVKLQLYWVPLVCYLIHIVFYSLYMNPIANGLRGEMFPTKYKTILSAFVSTFAVLATYFILQCFIPIKTKFGIHANFIIASVSSFSLVVLTYFFLIETEGKSLQEIQNSLNPLPKGTLESNEKQLAR